MLGPAREVLAGLGCEVIDAAPDLSAAPTRDSGPGGRCGTRPRSARCWSATRTDLGPNVAWNVRRGLELTAADLSRATQLLASLAGRISDYFDRVDVLACPATQVAAFGVDLDWVHEIDGVPQHTYLDWMASAYLISATGLPALSVPAGFTPAGLPGRPAARRAAPRGLVVAQARPRVRGGDRLRPDAARAGFLGRRLPKAAGRTGAAAVSAPPPGR